jgi:hypothetical protein
MKWKRCETIQNIVPELELIDSLEYMKIILKRILNNLLAL